MNDEVFITNLSTENDIPVDIKDVETAYAEALEKKMPKPRNRAERRALQKKVGAKNFNEFTTAAKKLAYINLIQKLREREEKESKENEGTQD